MGMAAVHLHWPPPVFWASTPHELYAAFEVLSGPPEDDFYDRMRQAGHLE